MIRQVLFPITDRIIHSDIFTGDQRGPIKNVTVPGQALTAILDSLHPSFSYNIRIRANNSIGLGSPSHQVAAKLLEEGNHHLWHHT